MVIGISFSLSGRRVLHFGELGSAVERRTRAV